MPTVEQSVDVKVTMATANRQSTLVESFPQWMERVAAVERTEPDGGQETPSQVLYAVGQVVAADLGRFKDFIEAREPAHAGAEAKGEHPVSLTGNAKAALR